MRTLPHRSQRGVHCGRDAPAMVGVRDGVIAAINNCDATPSGSPISDFGNAVVMPGLVDTHVHINEAGRTNWGGFATATRPAAAGGVTTLVEMPLNSIPTTTVAAYQRKLAAAEGQL